MTQDYQVLARKYRPQTFAEVLGQESIVTTLKNGIKYNRLAHAYLFCGSRGTGKTTLARVFAKGLNCENRNNECEPCCLCSSCKEITFGGSLEVLEIDGASHRGIDDVRQINETVGYAAPKGRYKIYIIDEVHMLTKEAFNALLKTLEEPPAKVKFFFATTEPHKVPVTILSRCQRFNLNRIPLQKIIDKLAFIVAEQKITIEQDAIRLIAERADGGFRDAESLLDQILAFHEGCISASSVASVLGIVPREVFFQLDAAGREGNLTAAFEIGHSIFSEGKDIFHFVELLTDHFRTITLIKLAGIDAPFIELSELERERYAQSAQSYTVEQCSTILDLLIEMQSKIRFMPSPRIALEALLLKILKIHQRIPIDFLVRRLVEVEEILGKRCSDQSIALKSVANALTPFKDQSSKEVKNNQKISTNAEEPHCHNSSLSITEDPTPSLSDLGIKKIDSTQFSPSQKMTVPLSKGFASSEEQQKDAKKKQSRYDTLLQFAAIELEGSLHKKPIRGF